MEATENILTTTRFFINNTCIRNARLKLTKDQAKTKQHPEAELLLFENYWLFSSTLSFLLRWGGEGWLK